jgi:hypothetical protein
MRSGVSASAAAFCIMKCGRTVWHVPDTKRSTARLLRTGGLYGCFTVSAGAIALSKPCCAASHQNVHCNCRYAQSLASPGSPQTGISTVSCTQLMTFCSARGYTLEVEGLGSNVAPPDRSVATERWERCSGEWCAADPFAACDMEHMAQACIIVKCLLQPCACATARPLSCCRRHRPAKRNAVNRT